MRQLKVNVSDELLERLDEARTKYKRRAPGSVAAEVVDQYLYLWIAAEEKRVRDVRRQVQRELEKLSPREETEEVHN